MSELSVRSFGLCEVSELRIIVTWPARNIVTTDHLANFLSFGVQIPLILFWCSDTSYSSTFLANV